MIQPDSHTVADADVSPFTVAKPDVHLHADETKKSRKTSIADDGADAAGCAQRRLTAFHYCAPASDGQPLTSRRTMRPASPCRSEGSNKPSVGFKSMSIQ